MTLEDQQKKTTEISIVPLINVVFLLLIFFMVSGTAINPNEAEVDVPLASTGEALSPTLIEIAITRDNQLLFNNSPAADMKAITLMLQDAKRQEGLLSVSVKADGAANADQLLRVMKLLKLEDVSDVRLITQMDLNR